ncbi:MAG: hypothetical protein R3321_10595 [Nitrososphaeraceae archaeon]|nr:hypothetical protein [Nitrososphaeraceae archaeon]
MKKFLVFILLVAGGYFVYDNFVKEKEVLEIKATKNIATNYSSDINAPALAPKKYGSIKGTVKNVSDKTVSNIVLKYKLNAEPVEARIDRLAPGEVKNFSTKPLMLKHSQVTFFLEDKSYQ